MTTNPPLPPAIVHAVWSAIGSVPGCSFAHAVHGKVQNDPNVATVRVGMTGWSPSLHKVEIERVVTIPLTAVGDMTTLSDMPDRADVPMLAAHVVAGLEPLLEVQRRRAASALAAGFPWPIDAVSQHLDDLRHLHVDVSMIALQIERAMHHDEDPSRAIGNVLSRNISELHREAMNHPGDCDLANPRTTVSDATGVPTAGVMYNVSSDPRFRLEEATVFVHGNQLSVMGIALPTTLIAAAPGRRVGDVCPVHPYLDGRVIASAAPCDDDFPGFDLVLEPLNAPLAGLIGATSRQALATLGFDPLPAPALATASLHGGDES